MFTKRNLCNFINNQVFYLYTGKLTTMRKAVSNLFDKAKKSNAVLVYWKLTGKKIPPPHVYKQSVIKKLAREYKIDEIVETGTYKGDMIEALKSKFRRLTSIELSEFYFKLSLIHI